MMSDTPVKHPAHSRKKRVRRILRMATGIGLILFGLVGIVVPVLPGWTPIALGVVILAPKTRFSRWLRGWLRKLKRRGSKPGAPPS